MTSDRGPWVRLIRDCANPKVDLTGAFVGPGLQDSSSSVTVSQRLCLSLQASAEHGIKWHADRNELMDSGDW
ncbi:MAG: hypothetical protein OEY70_13550 [Acidimicrobiia bacterium]|nr:hypothetical protein [Acidimicrobiia bacterium]